MTRTATPDASKRHCSNCGFPIIYEGDSRLTGWGWMDFGRYYHAVSRRIFCVFQGPLRADGSWAAR